MGEVLVLTNKRVVYIRSNAVMGGYSSDWEYEYSRMQLQVPTIQKEGSKWYIFITPQQEERKVLGGLFNKSSGKKIHLPDGYTKESATFLARMIHDLQTCQDNYEPVFMKMIQQKSN